MLKILTFMLLCATAAAAQTTPPPDPTPPACLSGPVTQGSVTLNCTAIDNTAYGAAADGGNYGYVFQARVTSSDPDVVAARITLIWQAPIAGDPQHPFVTTRAVNVNKTGGAFVYTFSISAGYDQSLNPVPFFITSVQVQELKASSSQTF